MPDKGYCEGNSGNLPTVDAFMVAAYFSSNPSLSSDNDPLGERPKRSRASNYGDGSIGFVQLKRDGDICTVKACVKPEGIKRKDYKVMMLCEESESKILSVRCEDCFPVLGTCDHATAFLMWLHRRSEEPKSSHTVNYWFNPELDTSKMLKIKDIFGFKQETPQKCDDLVLKAFIEHCKENKIESLLMNYFHEPEILKCMSIHRLIHRFFTLDIVHNAKGFLEFCQNEMSSELCSEVSTRTLGKTKSEFAMEMRYARIPASIAFEAINKKDESFVDLILGDFILKDRKSKKSRDIIKNSVLKELSKQRNIYITEGKIVLKNSCPVLIASPDGITEEFVVEIKCPTTEKQASQYLTKTKKIPPRYVAKIQLQMYFCGKKRALYCIANRNFKVTKQINIFEVEYNENFCISLINDCTNFWCKNVFPQLAHTIFDTVKQEPEVQQESEIPVTVKQEAVMISDVSQETDANIEIKEEIKIPCEINQETDTPCRGNDETEMSFRNNEEREVPVAIKEEIL